MDDFGCDLDFGEVSVGTGAAVKLGYVSNSGRGPICLIATQSSQAAFTADFPQELPPLQARKFGVYFDPALTGFAEAEVRIELEGDPGVVVCTLRGTGI